SPNREISKPAGDGINPVCRDNVIWKRRPLINLTSSACRIVVSAALRQWIVNRNHLTLRVAVVRKVSAKHVRRWDSQTKQISLPLAKTFVTSKEKDSIADHRTANVATKLILHKRSFAGICCVCEEVVRVQHLVAKELIRAAMKRVTAGFG